MNVHIQNKIYKPIAFVLSVLMLSISIAHCCPMVAHAETVDATFDRLIDSILAQTGVSANYSYVSRVSSEVANILRGSAGTYEDYCEAQALEQNAESWAAYLNSDAYYNQGNLASEFWKTLFGTTWFITHYFDVLICGSDYSNFSNDELVNAALTGDTTLRKGRRYDVPDEAVEAVRATFDEIVEDDGLGYYYIDTFGPDNVDPSWFPDAESYNNFKSYIRSSDNYTYTHMSFLSNINFPSSRAYNQFCIGDNSQELYLVCPESIIGNNYSNNRYLYDSEWQMASLCRSIHDSSYGMNIPFASNDEFQTLKESEEIHTQLASNFSFGSLAGYYAYTDKQWSIIFSSDGRKMIVFESLADLKKYLAGYREVYTSVTYDYSTANDNSLTVGGDYLLDESYSYSHDVVENNIDNSSETITEETVNNIVGDTIQNITNNYYGGSGAGNNNSNNTDSGASVWDGLTTLVSGIGDMLNFFVTLIGEVLSLLTNMLTQIMDLIGNFRDVSGDFVYFMSDFFVFVPQEVWDVILLGVTAIIGLAIWKAFKS